MTKSNRILELKYILIVLNPSKISRLNENQNCELLYIFSLSERESNGEGKLISFGFFLQEIMMQRGI